jgi:hypothetical protein
MDTDLLLLIVLLAFVIWVLVVIWNYAQLQTAKPLSEQDDLLFGKGVRHEYQRFRLAIIPRATSAQSFFIIVTIAVVAGFLLKSLGLI